MKKIYSAVIAGILLVTMISGCLNGAEKTTYVDVSVQQAKQMIDRGEVFILDVRTQEEYNEGHLRGSILIPVEELGTRLEEIPIDKKILVYCRSGHRSATASDILGNSGFTQIYSMQGGITEWENAGYEVVK